MLQEIVIKANAEESIKPLVETAIRNQLKALQHGISRTKERITKFEKRAGISSVEFEEKLQAGGIEETIETIDWNMELAALHLLEGQYHSLSEAKLIEQNFQSILDLLASLPFIESSDVNLEKRGELVGFVRGRVEFQDGLPCCSSVN